MIVSSFDENPCPPSAQAEEIERNPLGLDPVDKVDGQVEQTVIRGLLPWQPLSCKTMHALKQDFIFLKM